MKNSTSAYLKVSYEDICERRAIVLYKDKAEARGRTLNPLNKQYLKTASVQKWENRHHHWQKLHYGSYLRLDSDSYCFTRLSMLQKALEIINT